MQQDYTLQPPETRCGLGLLELWNPRLLVGAEDPRCRLWCAEQVPGQWDRREPNHAYSYLSCISLFGSVEMWGRSSTMRTMVDIVLDVYTIPERLQIHCTLAHLYICTFAHLHISLQTTCPTRHCEKLAEAKDYPIRSSSYTKQTNQRNWPKSTNSTKCGVKCPSMFLFPKKKQTSPKRIMCILRSFFLIYFPHQTRTPSLPLCF